MKMSIICLLNMWTHMRQVSLYRLNEDGDINPWKQSQYDMTSINLVENPSYRCSEKDQFV